MKSNKIAILKQVNLLFCIPAMRLITFFLCVNFASGLAESTDFSNWLTPRRGKCNKNKLSTMPTKSGRFSSSPIIMFFMKLLNNVRYILPSHCACRSCVSGKCLLTYLTYLTYSILISHHVYIVFIFFM